MANIENLTITRLVAHEVFTQSEIAEGRKPVLSEALITLDENGKDLVARRVSEALGLESRCLEVELEDSGRGSAFEAAKRLFECTDADFLQISSDLAKKLTAVQNLGSIKSGLLVVFQATAGNFAQPHRMIGIIKAESESAFSKKAGGKVVSLDFIKDIVFGEQQRLFKIGAFIEHQPHDPARSGRERFPEDFLIVVYDHMMNIKGEGKPARYFYGSFLGTTITKSATLLNRVFFDTTSDYIRKTRKKGSIERWTLQSHLVSYFRSNEATISGRVFAERFLERAERRAYYKALRLANFPRNAVAKDVRAIESQLRTRKLRFTNRVQIVVPADALGKAVTIIATEPEHTDVRIAGRLESDSA